MTFLLTSKFFFLVHKILFGANLMNEKKRYRILCDTEQSIPLFSQAWWLDNTVIDAKWDVAIVENKGVILATMPYLIKKFYGFTILSMPSLTQNLGPWLKTSEAKYYNAYNIKISIKLYQFYLKIA